jgi:hypothetical protein
MAPTKRKRRTKHRGNAAGSIEARGRTGRPPTGQEKKKADRAKLREERLLKEPTWSQSFRRASLAAGLMFVFLLVTDHSKNAGSPVITAVLFAIIAMVIYVPAGYYLERFLWRRRMAKMGKSVRR